MQRRIDGARSAESQRLPTERRSFCVCPANGLGFSGAGKHPDIPGKTKKRQAEPGSFRARSKENANQGHVHCRPELDGPEKC